MSTPIPDAGIQVGSDVATEHAQPNAAAPVAPASFADTPYDVLRDVTMPDGTVLTAGSTTTPAALGRAGDIPAVHAMVVAGDIWPTGVAH